MNLLPRFLQDFLPGLPPGVARDPPRPAAPLCLVGDIHGCLDPLDRLLAALAADPRAAGAQLVFLGDYVDRGPQSAGVLDRLRGLQADRPGAVTCLRGNHEQMLLDFLDDPAARGPRWYRNGGAQTLASFGLTRFVPERAPAPVWQDLAAAFRDRLPPGLEDWLRALPLSWSSGTVWAVHAAARPARAMPDQPARVLLWGDARFLDTPRRDGIWVVHGHTVVDVPLVSDGRIAVDTGAVHGGGLTAALLDPAGAVGFLTV